MFMAPGLAVILLMAAYAAGLRRFGHGQAMIEPIFGFMVAVGLGLYLLYSLVPGTQAEQSYFQPEDQSISRTIWRAATDDDEHYLYAIAL